MCVGGDDGGVCFPLRCGREETKLNKNSLRFFLFTLSLGEVRQRPSVPIMAGVAAGVTVPAALKVWKRGCEMK